MIKAQKPSLPITDGLHAWWDSSLPDTINTDPGGTATSVNLVQDNGSGTMLVGAVGHGLIVGERVWLSGTSVTQFNGYWTVSALFGANAFFATYTSPVTATDNTSTGMLCSGEGVYKRKFQDISGNENHMYIASAGLAVWPSSNKTLEGITGNQRDVLYGGSVGAGAPNGIITDIGTVTPPYTLFITNQYTTGASVRNILSAFDNAFYKLGFFGVAGVFAGSSQIPAFQNAEWHTYAITVDGVNGKYYNVSPSVPAAKVGTTWNFGSNNLTDFTLFNSINGQLALTIAGFGEGGIYKKDSGTMPDDEVLAVLQYLSKKWRMN